MEIDDLISVLKDAGLSPYQADAYVTLLELGSASAQALAEASEVPGPRIYDVLRELEDHGYVATYKQDQLYARAIDPSDALTGLRTRARQFDAAVDEIEQRWQRPDLQQHEISLVRRFQTIFDQVRRELRNATEYVHLFLTPDQLQDLRPALAAAQTRDVYIELTIYDISETPPLNVAELKEVCTEARWRRDSLWLGPFGALIDRRRACFAWYPESQNEYGVFVDERGHEALFWYFLLSVWEQCEVLYSASPLEPPLRFGEIRDCVRVINPLVREEATLHAKIEGQRVATNQECELTGTVCEIDYPGLNQGKPPTPFQLLGDVTLALEADEEVYTAGGYFAREEEIEAERIIINAIEQT